MLGRWANQQLQLLAPEGRRGEGTAGWNRRKRERQTRRGKGGGEGHKPPPSFQAGEADLPSQPLGAGRGGGGVTRPARPSGRETRGAAGGPGGGGGGGVS